MYMRAVRKPLFVVYTKRNCCARKLRVRAAQAPRKLRYHPIDYVRCPAKTTVEYHYARASAFKLAQGRREPLNPDEISKNIGQPMYTCVYIYTHMCRCMNQIRVNMYVYM